MPRRFSWSTLPEDKLLQLRLKDLDVTVRGTWLEECFGRLCEELAHKGLKVQPHVWISDEWFSPDSTPGIAIPFYLAHPRLMRLERQKMSDVEGGTMTECMRILRHEAGHVVQHAYQLQRRRRWQRLFGRSSLRYPSYYRPNPASKQYVQHLRLWYAQSHPDEDFAETFAVWLTPRSAWRQRYASWPALRKLHYVDELMAEIADEAPMLTQRLEVDPLSRLNRTLAKHYQRKQALYAADTPTTYDRELLRLFADGSASRRAPAASTFLLRNKAKIKQMVSKWTGEYQLTLDVTFDDMLLRCRQLKLRAVGSERQMMMDFVVLLTAQTVHSLYSPSRRRWFAL
jgi:hypothetical protein